MIAGIGHNQGPSLERGQKWRTFQWQKAREAAMPSAIPLMVVKMRVARARELGLINRIAPSDELATQTTALAQQIADKLGTAVKIGKQAFYAQLAMPVAQAYVYTGDVMVENMLNPDTAEGIAAFLEKRTPEWDQ